MRGFGRSDGRKGLYLKSHDLHLGECFRKFVRLYIDSVSFKNVIYNNSDLQNGEIVCIRSMDFKRFATA
jgi:hypothetical protein